jgi:hypothetical protein
VRASPAHTTTTTNYLSTMCHIPGKAGTGAIMNWEQLPGEVASWLCGVYASCQAPQSGSLSVRQCICPPPTHLQNMAICQGPRVAGQQPDGVVLHIMAKVGG